jgi:hypothetical protein
MLGARAAANNDWRPWKWEVDGHGGGTPSVPLNFKELGFLAGIKGCVNFNMTNPVTKKTS